MSDIGIGKLIVGAANRDAIHVAITPVTATEKIAPGDWIKFAKAGDTDRVCRANEADGVGIADPFLTRVAFDGDRLWMCLRPGSITSLRHEWTHPAFGPAAATATFEKDVSASAKWIRAYVEKHCPYDEDKPDKGYAQFMDNIRSGRVFYHGEDLCGLNDLDDADDLRFHLETVLGTRINWDEFSFSCSC